MGQGRGQLRAVQRMERWGKQVSDSTTGWTNRTKLGLGSLGLGGLAIGAGIGAYLYTNGAEKSATNETDAPGATNLHLKGSQGHWKEIGEYRMIIQSASGATTAPLDETPKLMLIALLNGDKTDSDTLRRLDDGGFEWRSLAKIRKPEVGGIILCVAGASKVVDLPSEEWGLAETTTFTRSTNGTITTRKGNELALLVHVAMMHQSLESFPGARRPGTDRSKMTLTALSLNGEWLEPAATCTPTDEGLACQSGNVNQLLFWPTHSMSRPPEPAGVAFGHNRASRRPVVMYTE